MPVQPTLAPRAEALWERQQDPVASFLSSLFGSPDNTDSVATSQPTPTTTRAFTTTSSSSRFTRTTTSPSSSPPHRPLPSSSTFIITTSSPSTLISTSQVVSGTITSQVVLTTVVTPVVTTTAAAARSNSSSSGSNGGLIGGLVGGVIGGLALIALIITICVMASRRKSRTGHAYFLCFGERPSRNAAGDLRHSGGAWPTFDPQDDHRNSSYAAGAAGVGAGAGAAASPSRRTRREQTNATLPAEFANEQDPERYGYSGSAAAHNGYPAAANQYDAGYDAYDAYGTSGYPDMQQSPARNGAGALAAGAAAGGAGVYLYNNSSPAINRRSSAGHPSHDSTSYANMSPHATALNKTAPAPWTLPMMGWQDTHGPYSVAGVGGNMVTASPPQAQFMVSPSEANRAAAAGAGAGGVAGAAAGTPTRSTGPDYSHFDPPEIRDARAREAAAEALARGSFSTAHSYRKPTWPRRQPRRLSSSQATPINQHSNLAAGGAMAPPAYVDAQDGIMEEMDDQPRRLHLTNAEPDVTTDDDSSRGGPTRRPTHNHKDQPPAATYRQH
ncbi:hypothetical protein NDA18_006258 [Ustilago nuda]|nr:hypothetical protein NDA18_006258 [Ustilago nuda]